VSNCLFEQSTDEIFPAAWPLADATLTQELLDLMQQATHLRQAKKGANEGKLELISFLLFIFAP
jgi:hypothetical protein